jgi:hypothetical protein
MGGLIPSPEWSISELRAEIKALKERLARLERLVLEDGK